MGRRLALLIATYDYQDSGLRRLTAPAHDAEALAAVLRDPRIAGFEVTSLTNQPHHRVGEAIGDFYRDRRRDDLTLLYFTGHGLKDDDGQLYLAMSNTRRDSLLFTGLPAEHVDRAMSACMSRQKVLILDCCYSGAFPAGRITKADTAVHTLERFQGHGRTVLTASDATQYSFEGNQAHGEAAQSVFTRFLVEGLRDGSADLDGDGDITLDELYGYVHDRVVQEMPQQRPKRQDNVEGRIVVARNINWELPTYLRHAIESPIATGRLAALDGLTDLHRIGNDTVRERVREEVRRLADDDSRVVSQAAAALLRTLAPTRTEPLEQAAEPAARVVEMPAPAAGPTAPAVESPEPTAVAPAPAEPPEPVTEAPAPHAERPEPAAEPPSPPDPVVCVPQEVSEGPAGPRTPAETPPSRWPDVPRRTILLGGLAAVAAVGVPTGIVMSMSGSDKDGGTSASASPDPVTTVVFDRDGGRLATAGYLTPEVPLWDTATGRRTATLNPGDDTGVYSLAFSPDGKTLAMGCGDNGIRLLDPVTRRVTATLTGHNGETGGGGVLAVAFSPDGKTLASGGADYTVRLWNVADGRNTVTITDHTDNVYAVAFSPDGKTVASGSTDKTAGLWSVPDGRSLATVTGLKRPVASVVFSPDGETLAIVAGEQFVTLWDVATKRSTTAGDSDSGVLSAAFSPDGKTLALGEYAGSVVLMNLATTRTQATLTGHNREVAHVVFSPDGKTLATGSWDGTARLWDLATGRTTFTLPGTTATATATSS
ncbi:caspase family protein [Streptomyces sp. NPDC088387]|uniref:caspase, EACC1-associated type n=1 Tax=Streptomyces sp. NPDC088387 TaxID=3365859 RepID=UPI0037F1C782